MRLGKILLRRSYKSSLAINRHFINLAFSFVENVSKKQARTRKPISRRNSLGQRSDLIRYDLILYTGYPKTKEREREKKSFLEVWQWYWQSERELKRIEMFKSPFVKKSPGL